jgi:4-methylaminobutanoate oxidase (formaldehyde-forming)
MELGMALVRAHRVTYVGELGWELYMPTEFARYVFDVIMAAGAPHGLKLVGVNAMDTLRLEKAYRHFGHDIADEDHVLEAGLGFAVKPNKPRSKFGDFIGREAVLAKKREGMSRRLVQFKLDDPEPLLYHSEPIIANGAIVGYLTSGGFGHSLGAAIGLGYVPCRECDSAERLLAHRFEIEVAGRAVPALASLKPMYDPSGDRVRF